MLSDRRNQPLYQTLDFANEGIGEPVDPLQFQSKLNNFTVDKSGMDSSPDDPVHKKEGEVASH